MKEILSESVGIILWNTTLQKYLLLQRRDSSLWEFPKGHIEDGELHEDTMKREVFEETGIEDCTVLKFVDFITFQLIKEEEEVIKNRKIYYYTGETIDTNVVISDEHNQFKWLDEKEVLSLLKFNNMKELFLNSI